MTLKSTGLATYIAVTGSMRAALNGGFLMQFSGPVPASADDAVDESCVMLNKSTAGGDGSTGLTFEATAPGGVLSKTEAEVWEGDNAASGSVTFYRFCEAGDDGTAASTTLKRVQGSVGTTVASDGVLTSTALEAGDNLSIDIFQLF